MSNYTQTTAFGPKDALLSGNPAKLIKGADFDVEFAAIAAAIATKLDSSNAANPTASVGLAAVNGVAATYMRSDSAPALSQAITPTWTAQHTYTLSGGGSTSALLLNSAQPAIGMRASGGAADSKLWDLTVNSTDLLGRIINDAGSTTRNWLDVVRSATAVASINFGNATDNNTIGFLGTGKATFGGAVDITGLARAADDGGSQQTLGWRDVPQNTQNASYTFVLADRGKQVFFNGASGQTYTIPANSVTAFPIGTTIVVINFTATNLSIAINTDNLFLAGTASSGTRTLSGVSMCTLVKVTTTSWYISGVGLS